MKASLLSSCCCWSGQNFTEHAPSKPQPPNELPQLVPKHQCDAPAAQQQGASGRPMSAALRSPYLHAADFSLFNCGHDHLDNHKHRKSHHVPAVLHHVPAVLHHVPMLPRPTACGAASSATGVLHHMPAVLLYVPVVPCPRAGPHHVLHHVPMVPTSKHLRSASCAGSAASCAGGAAAEGRQDRIERGGRQCCGQCGRDVREVHRVGVGKHGALPVQHIHRPAAWVCTTGISKTAFGGGHLLCVRSTHASATYSCKQHS